VNNSDSDQYKEVVSDEIVKRFSILIHQQQQQQQ
jgi:hypothetical protein